MSGSRAETNPVTQHELRFTVRDPNLASALMDLERHEHRDGDPIERQFFLYAMKTIALDPSDAIDGRSQNESDFGQWRESVQRLSSNGRHRMHILPGIRPLQTGGQAGPVIGVGMRLQLSDLDVHGILKKPFYTSEQATQGLIPVRYELPPQAEYSEEAAERIRTALTAGAHVMHMAVVARYPRSSRTRNIYNDEPLNYTYQEVPLPAVDPITEPIDFVHEAEVRGRPIKNAS